MSEADRTIVTEMRAYDVSMKCPVDDCNGRMFAYRDAVTLTVAEYPARHSHKCTVCGTHEDYEYCYPYTSYRLVSVEVPNDEIRSVAQRAGDNMSGGYKPGRMEVD